ncbi:haloacid dehalogenase-like hydrolase [Phyllosticta citrichinensis]|uniref:Haloacid dehalogenase-like hydrolase n=1 Tax=Phyllosticta citrichinensis TaxID=1130410 RepID=A0ABR1Y4H4_9PEZI
MAATSPTGSGAAASPASSAAAAAPSPAAMGMASGGNGSGAVSRRFAPLDPAKARRLVGQENVRWVRGVVFDVDGTLCEPQNYMFTEMRAALAIPPQVDILDHIYALPPAQQPAAFSLIQAIERRAMAVQTPQPGLVPLMDYLESRMLHKAICTRNFDAPVLHLLEKFLPGHSFDPIITRDFRPPKPSPAGVLHIAKKWGCLEPPVAAAGMPPLPPLDSQAVVPPSPLTPPEPGADFESMTTEAGAGIVGSAPSLIMVGDSLDDMVAGRRAGAATVLLLNESNMHLARREETDLLIRRLDDLIVVLENGFVGQHGT